MVGDIALEQRSTEARGGWVRVCPRYVCSSQLFVRCRMSAPAASMFQVPLQRAISHDFFFVNLYHGFGIEACAPFFLVLSLCEMASLHFHFSQRFAWVGWLAAMRLAGKTAVPGSHSRLFSATCRFGPMHAKASRGVSGGSTCSKSHLGPTIDQG